MLPEDYRVGRFTDTNTQYDPNRTQKHYKELLFACDEALKEDKKAELNTPGISYCIKNNTKALAIDIAEFFANNQDETRLEALVEIINILANTRPNLCVVLNHCPDTLLDLLDKIAAEFIETDEENTPLANEITTLRARNALFKKLKIKIHPGDDPWQALWLHRLIDSQSTGDSYAFLKILSTHFRFVTEASKELYTKECNYYHSIKNSISENTILYNNLVNQIGIKYFQGLLSLLRENQIIFESDFSYSYLLIGEEYPSKIDGTKSTLSQHYFDAFIAHLTAKHYFPFKEVQLIINHEISTEDLEKLISAIANYNHIHTLRLSIYKNTSPEGNAELTDLTGDQYRRFIKLAKNLQLQTSIIIGRHFDKNYLGAALKTVGNGNRKNVPRETTLSEPSSFKSDKVNESYIRPAKLMKGKQFNVTFNIAAENANITASGMPHEITREQEKQLKVTKTHIVENQHQSTLNLFSTDQLVTRQRFISDPALHQPLKRQLHKTLPNLEALAKKDLNEVWNCLVNKNDHLQGSVRAFTQAAWGKLLENPVDFLGGVDLYDDRFKVRTDPVYGIIIDYSITELQHKCTKETIYVDSSYYFYVVQNGMIAQGTKLLPYYVLPNHTLSEDDFNKMDFSRDEKLLGISVPQYLESLIESQEEEIASGLKECIKRYADEPVYYLLCQLQSPKDVVQLLSSTFQDEITGLGSLIQHEFFRKRNDWSDFTHPELLKTLEDLNNCSHEESKWIKAIYKQHVSSLFYYDYPAPTFRYDFFKLIQSFLTFFKVMNDLGLALPEKNILIQIYNNINQVDYREGNYIVSLNVVRFLKTLEKIIKHLPPANRQQFLLHLNKDVSFHESDAPRAVFIDGFKYIHGAMALKAENINVNYEEKVLGKDPQALNYIITREHLMKMALYEHKNEEDINYTLILFHRYLGRVNYLHRNYQMYINMGKMFEQDIKPLQPMLLTLLALATSGEYGHTFNENQLKQFFKLIKKSNQNHTIIAAKQIIKDIDSLSITLSLTELTGLMKFYVECEEKGLENIGTDNRLSGMHKAFAIWGENTHSVDLHNLLDILTFIKASPIFQESDYINIVACITAVKYGRPSAMAAETDQLLNALRNLAYTHHRFSEIVSYLAHPRIISLDIPQPTVDELTAIINKIYESPKTSWEQIINTPYYEHVPQSTKEKVSFNNLPDEHIYSLIEKALPSLQKIFTDRGVRALQGIETTAEPKTLILKGNDLLDSKYIESILETHKDIKQDFLGIYRTHLISNACRTYRESYNSIPENFIELWPFESKEEITISIINRFSIRYAMLFHLFEQYKKSWKEFDGSILTSIHNLPTIQSDEKGSKNISIEETINLLENIKKSAHDRVYPASLLKEIFSGPTLTETQYEDLNKFISLENAILTPFQKNQLIKALLKLFEEKGNYAAFMATFNNHAIYPEHITYLADVYASFVKIPNMSLSPLINHTIPKLQQIFLNKKNDSDEKLWKGLMKHLANYPTDLSVLDSIVNATTDDKKYALLKIVYYTFLKKGKTPSSELLTQLRDTNKLEDILNRYRRPPYPNVDKLTELLTGNIPVRDEEHFSLAGVETQLNQIRDLVNKKPLSYPHREKLRDWMLYVHAVGSDQPLVGLEHLGYQRNVADKVPVRKLTDEQLIDFTNTYRLKIRNPNDLSLAAIEMMKLEYIALIREVMYRATGKFPYVTQIEALLNIMLQGGNVLNQIGTGQGKGILIALINALKLLEPVDCIISTTSSLDLANSDADKFEDFYAYLGLSSGIVKKDSPDLIYDVCYTTMPQASLLLQRLALQPNKTPKKYGLSIDEFDELYRSTELYNIAIPIKAVTETLDENENQDIYILAYDFVTQSSLAFEKTRDGKDVGSKRDVNNFLTHVQKLETRPPAHTFAKILTTPAPALNFWLEAAYNAAGCKLNEHYEIKRDENGNPIVVVKSPITHQSFQGALFKDALHEILLTVLNRRIDQQDQTIIKLTGGKKFKVRSERVSLSSRTAKVEMDHVCKNAGSITGLSGTTSDYVPLNRDYHFSIFEIPPHQPSRRKGLPHIIARKKDYTRWPWSDKTITPEQAHYKTILQEIREGLKQKLPILLFCNTIDELHKLQNYLNENLTVAELKQFLTFDGLNQNITYDYAVQNAGTPSAITLTTSRLSRGADPKINPYVIDTAIVGALEYRQRLGRTGRNGQPGTHRLIISETELSNYRKKYPNKNPNDQAFITEVQNRLDDERFDDVVVHHRSGDIPEQYFQNYLLIIHNAFSQLSKQEGSQSLAWNLLERTLLLNWKNFLNILENRWQSLLTEMINQLKELKPEPDSSTKVEHLKIQLDKLVNDLNPQWMKVQQEMFDSIQEKFPYYSRPAITSNAALSWVDLTDKLPTLLHDISDQDAFALERGDLNPKKAYVEMIRRVNHEMNLKEKECKTSELQKIEIAQENITETFKTELQYVFSRLSNRSASTSIDGQLKWCLSILLERFFADYENTKKTSQLGFVPQPALVFLYEKLMSAINNYCMDINDSERTENIANYVAQIFEKHLSKHTKDDAYIHYFRMNLITKLQAGYFTISDNKKPKSIENFLIVNQCDLSRLKSYHNLFKPSDRSVIVKNLSNNLGTEKNEIVNQTNASSLQAINDDILCDEKRSDWYRTHRNVDGSQLQTILRVMHDKAMMSLVYENKTKEIETALTADAKYIEDVRKSLIKRAEMLYKKTNIVKYNMIAKNQVLLNSLQSDDKAPDQYNKIVDLNKQLKTLLLLTASTKLKPSERAFHHFMRDLYLRTESYITVAKQQPKFNNAVLLKQA